VIRAADLGILPQAERPRGVVDGLLMDPGQMVDDAQSADAPTQAATVRVLLLAILGGTAVFGAALGFYRGGLQLLYAALKLPLVVLLTAAVATPAMTMLGAGLGREARLRVDLIQVLAALARGSLVLGALAPLMLVASCVRLDYHRAVLLAVVCCAGAGVTALPLLLRAVWREERGRGFLIAAMLVVVTMAGTHTAWLFRPYLVRPRTTDVPFLRALDGSFVDSVSRSQSAARGIYVGRYRAP
jgi:hypothetical protein